MYFINYWPVLYSTGQGVAILCKVSANYYSKRGAQK